MLNCIRRPGHEENIAPGRGKSVFRDLVARIGFQGTASGRGSEQHRSQLLELRALFFQKAEEAVAESLGSRLGSHLPVEPGAFVLETLHEVQGDFTIYRTLSKPD